MKISYEEANMRTDDRSLFWKFLVPLVSLKKIQILNVFNYQITKKPKVELFL